MSREPGLFVRALVDPVDVALPDFTVLPGVWAPGPES